MRSFIISLCLALPVLAVPPGKAPCQGSDCFQQQADCDCPPCIDGLQAAVDATRTLAPKADKKGSLHGLQAADDARMLGPRVDVKATLTAFLRNHPDTAVLVVGQEQGKLGLRAYQGLLGTSLVSRFPFAEFAVHASTVGVGDADLASLLLPEPIQARLLKAKALVVVPLDGFPKVDFAGLLPKGWNLTLGQTMKVTVVRRFESLDKL